MIEIKDRKRKMVKDLQLLRCPDILFKKKCVIWGAGKNGKILYRELLNLGIKEQNILLCDMNADKMKERGFSNILSLEQMVERTSVDKYNYLIIISVEALNIQDEIIGKIKEFNLFDLDVYTFFAAKCGILFIRGKRDMVLSQNEVRIRRTEREMLAFESRQNNIEYFTIASYLEQMFLIYQPKKVGSATIWSSLKKYGVQSLHVHELQELHYARKVMEKECGKIISAVRNPLEWRISLFWQEFENAIFLGEEYIDFHELQDKFFEETFKEREFQWFDVEMKEVMGIDVFLYPFNKERGYTIIKKGNIELLLLVSEKINTLEDIIGEFVGISDFKLENSNVSERKEYRFAYKEYKKEFRIPDSVFESICTDEHVRHFYTEEDIEYFREKWKRNIVDNNIENLKVKVGI